jgi:hypothetical protein
MLLPFTTFGEAASFDLEVELVCRCQRRVVINGTSDFFRERRIMGTRFSCTTILPHGARCTAAPSIYIRKRDRAGWTMGDHSRAMRARHAGAPPTATRGTFGNIVRRGEVAYFYDQGCSPAYTIDAVEFDEPPRDRFLNRPVERFVCPGCRKGLILHLHYGPARRRRSGSMRSPRLPSAPVAALRWHRPALASGP